MILPDPDGKAWEACGRIAALFVARVRLAVGIAATRDKIEQRLRRLDEARAAADARRRSKR